MIKQAAEVGDYPPWAKVNDKDGPEWQCRHQKQLCKQGAPV